MIVERITWLAKVGCHAEVIKILKGLNQQLGVSCTERIYSCEFGADDESVAIELEFESMEHRRACWREWFKQPEAHEQRTTNKTTDKNQRTCFMFHSLPLLLLPRTQTEQEGRQD